MSLAEGYVSVEPFILNTDGVCYYFLYPIVLVVIQRKRTVITFVAVFFL